MATQSADTSDFIKNLGRMYGLYTGGFLAFIVLLAVLEQVGVPNKVLGYLFVFFTLAVYAIIGIATRTAEVSEYYVAGRRVPAFYNGMATGADWMSAASFVGMAGTLFLLGYDGLAWVLGWTGGFVLVSILVGPYLRKFGAYTVPDFMSFRFGGNFTRFLAVIVLVCCSFTYVTAQIFGTGLIASRFLGMDFEVAVFVGLAGILLCSMLGGMRAVTWTQIAQYIVLIVAYLTPIVILSTKKYGIPIPELTYGLAIQDITAREQEMLRTGLATAADLKPHIEPFINYSPLNFFGIIFCMMVGTASLPHILMRYFTTPSVREARQSVAWSLFFIFLLYFSAPAYAAFSKLEVYTNIIGRDLTSDPSLAVHLGRARPDPDLRQECRKPRCRRRRLQGDRRASRRRAAAGLRDQYGRDRALHAGDRGPSVRDLGSGGRRRSRRRAVHRRRAAARHRQRALATTSTTRCSTRTRRRSAACSVARILLVVVAVCAAYTASTRPSDILAMVGMGVLARHGRQLPGAGHGHLVEASDIGRCRLRHHRRLRAVPLLPGDHALLPGHGRQVLRHDLAAQPGHGRADRRHRQGHGAAQCHGELADAGASDGQQGRLVQPQQHQLRTAGHAARVPGDLCGQPDDPCAVGRNAGLR